MKRFISFFLLAAFLLGMTGCRVRITGAPNADETIRSDREIYVPQVPTSPPETQPTNPETQPSEPETQPSEPATEPPSPQTQPPENEPPSQTQPTLPAQIDPGSTQPPSETAPPMPGPTGGAVGDGGSGGSGTGGSSGGEETQPPPETQEPEKTIRITLNANGGRCNPASRKSIMVAPGGTYVGLPEASRGGYTFTGWYSEKEGGQRVDETTRLLSEEPHTLYAHWTDRELYTVSFVIPDESLCWLGAHSKSIKVYNGQTYGTFPTPTCRRGYAFLGWFTDPDGGSKVSPGDPVQLNADLTLYPHLSYDPFNYWSGVLDNAPIYSCQIKTIYIEFDEDNVTTSYSALISMLRSVNAARAASDPYVTDAQIRQMGADVIVKCVSDMSRASEYYSALAARFPGKTIYILPRSAEWGSKQEVLYYALYLGSLLYSDAFVGLDLTSASADLGVSGSIYYG